MKKFWTASVLALGAVLASQQEAPAWVNFKVGIGFNWEWQSGGNNLFWGMINGGQPPGPQFFGYGQPIHVDGPSFYQGHHYDYFSPMPHQPQWTPPAPKQPGWTPPPPQPGNGQASYHAPTVYPASYYPGHNYYYPAYWYGR